MLVSDLIIKLQQVDGNNKVYIDDGRNFFDFTGVSFDDNDDIRLFICRRRYRSLKYII